MKAKEEFLEKQNSISNGILRTDSVISGKKSLDSVLGALHSTVTAGESLWDHH